jgi:3-methylcrotonyl-CoA carboxylase beta subunit
MSDIPSTLDTDSREFAANAEAMKALVTDLRSELEAAMQGGSEEARARHGARGKLLARERIELLLDPGTAATSIPRASSPASAASADVNASSLPTTPPSRVAPTIP